MSMPPDDDELHLKKTKKEGLDAAAREAMERTNTETKSPKDAKTDPMTGEKVVKKDSPKKEPKPALFLAEYKSPKRCIHAAEKLRDAGYTKFDAHTPFPVHGMDRAMGLPDSRLGWIVIVCALTGTASAFLMMWWMNCYDYPIVIGGKPPSASSIASMVPIMFELTILFSAFAAVFGMFGLNKIPQHNHPIFESDRFKSFSTDKFWISVEAEDPKFKLDKTRELLDKTHPEFVELVMQSAEGK
jgi:ActD protein